MSLGHMGNDAETTHFCMRIPGLHNRQFPESAADHIGRQSQFCQNRRCRHLIVYIENTVAHKRKFFTPAMEFHLHATCFHIHIRRIIRCRRCIIAVWTVYITDMMVPVVAE